ncbi:hypothetical protein ACDT16_13690 [Staphylococcus aureus]
MASADPPVEEDQLMEFFEDEPWAQRLGSQWEMRFEQREPPTVDQVVQINLGDESSPKPIFISESLTGDDRESLIQLVQDYIDIFAWSYEDMPGLDP